MLKSKELKEIKELKAIYYFGMIVEAVGFSVIVRATVNPPALLFFIMFVIGAVSSVVAGGILSFQKLENIPYIVFAMVEFGFCFWPA